MGIDGTVENFMLLPRHERRFGGPSGAQRNSGFKVHGELKVGIARELGYDPKNLTKDQYDKIMTVYKRRTS